jgi:hypothetical protein
MRLERPWKPFWLAITDQKEFFHNTSSILGLTSFKCCPFVLFIYFLEGWRIESCFHYGFVFLQEREGNMC